MGAGSRAQASRTRRDHILGASLDCFLERGVGATTVDQIRARSGASIGSFYHHFTGKVGVAAALYLETLESYQHDFLDELRTHERARNAIEGAVRSHLRWVGRHPKLASYLTHCREPEVAAASEARAQELNGVFFGEVGRWLRRQTERGHIRGLPPSVYYALWMGPAEVFTRLWLAEQSPARLAEAQASLPPAAWEALRASSALQRRIALTPLKRRRLQAR